MDDWVFIDTCIWAPFFGKPGSPEKLAVDELLDSDRVAIVGPIVAEVLMGFRRKDQADWVASRLRMAHYVEAGWDDWRAAADLGRELAAKVYTSDPHFDLIPNLKRCRPDQPIQTSKPRSQKGKKRP